MPTLGERPPSKYIKALAFGRSKVGKTFGAGTFPRPAFIDCDKGISTLTSADFVNRYGWRPTIEYEQFTEKHLNARGVPQQHNAFDDVCRYFDKLNSPAMRGSWDTLVVDTGTSLSAFAMIKAIVLLGGTFKGVSSSTQSEALTHGLVFPKIQDYGSERSMVEQFIGMCYDLDKNFLFLCHEKEITDKEGSPVAITPLLTGKGVEAICALFDDVWRIKVKPVGAERIRYIQTKQDGISQVGSRHGFANETLWDYDAIKKEWDKMLTVYNQKKQEKKTA